MVEKSYFDIHSLIAKGKEDVREYELPNGLVLIRPLTELELEEAELAMFDAVKDPDTRKFAFDSMMNGGSEDEEEVEFDTSKVNFTEFVKASNEFMYKICYLAMCDFTDAFEINDLKKIPGVKDLGEEILRISGYNSDTIEMVEEFREE